MILFLLDMQPSASSNSNDSALSPTASASSPTSDGYVKPRIWSLAQTAAAVTPSPTHEISPPPAGQASRSPVGMATPAFTSFQSWLGSSSMYPGSVMTSLGNPSQYSPLWGHLPMRNSTQETSSNIGNHGISTSNNMEPAQCLPRTERRSPDPVISTVTNTSPIVSSCINPNISPGKFT